MRAAVLASAVLAMVVVSADARAQGEAVIGLGLAVSNHDPTNDLGIGSTGIGPLIHLKIRTGLGPLIGLDWHTIGARATVDNERVYIGKLRVRPVMGGIGYNWSFGRYWVAAGVVAGYAFTTLRVDDRARPAFRTFLGASHVSFDTSGSFVWRPQVSVWYDAGTRVGIMAGLSYVHSQPTLLVESDGRGYKTRLAATSTVLTFGLVYGVF
ncbi:MAG: hypothetical protein ACM3NQ_16090 [Bacteroidales bacterium]